MKRILKLSYICLLITMIYISISSLSFNVYAKIQNDGLDEHQIYSDYKSEIKEKSINLNLFEIETLREESVKHFRLEDGTYRAVSYGRKVHQLDSNNKWIDFDNTLTLNNGYYKTTDNNLSFIKNINLNKPIVNFINEDYSLLLYIQSEQKLNAVEADVENNSVFYDSIRNKTIDDLINENKKIDASVNKEKTINKGVKLKGYEKAEKYLIYYMLNSKEVIRMFDRKVDHMLTDEYRILAREISDYYHKYNNIVLADFITYLNDYPKILATLNDILSADIKDDYTLEEIDGYIKTIRKSVIDNQIQKLNKRIKETDDFNKQLELLQKQVELKNQEI